jgi:signal transduction histidine kinase
MSEVRRLGGEVAMEVSHDVAEPMRGLRDRLGLLVDHLERFVATSTGPTPYPWRSLQSLRQDLAAAYLEVTQLARRLDELDSALAPASDTDVHANPGFDLAASVDHGVRLAAHHLGPEIELLVDLGTPLAVRGHAGTFALLIVQLIGVCARSARTAEGSSLSVRVSADDDAGVVIVTDNGGGDSRFDDIGELARSILAPWAATIDAASAPGQGCTFELRLALVLG